MGGAGASAPAFGEYPDAAGGACETQRKAILKESLAGPSPYERAAEVGLAHPNVALMQRMEESSFRQIWRITNLLLKLKRQAREEGYRETPARTGNVTENIGG